MDEEVLRVIDVFVRSRLDPIDYLRGKMRLLL